MQLNKIMQYLNSHFDSQNSFWIASGQVSYTVRIYRFIFHVGQSGMLQDIFMWLKMVQFLKHYLFLILPTDIWAL